MMKKISKEEQEKRKEKALKVNPEEILNGTCDQAKIEVLYHRKKHPAVIKWIMDFIHTHKIYIPDKPGYDWQDVESTVYEELYKITFPVFIKSGQWMYALKSYLIKAIHNLCVTYLNKESRHRSDIELDADGNEFVMVSTPNKEDIDRMGIRLIPLPKRQHRVMSLRIDDPLASYEVMSKYIGCKPKTIQRDKKQMEQNDLLKMMLREDSKNESKDSF